MFILTKLYHPVQGINLVRMKFCPRNENIRMSTLLNVKTSYH